MSKVFVLDATKQPLNPVHPGRARILLRSGQAAVYRRYPFTLILQHALERPVLASLRLKIDPGARTTGLALLNDASGEVVWAAELVHRGFAIKAALDARRSLRRNRRARQTRYRKPRWANRHRRTGWVPPSSESRISNVLTWVARLRQLCSITAISVEVVKFDLQAMQHPEISGLEYQQGELQGYELREYLLEKWHRQCAYCGKEGGPLQIDHIVPRAKAGTNRASNLTLACERCNRRKADQDVGDFLKKKPEVLARLLAQATTPLRDAAAVNTTRWRLYEQLKNLGLPLEGSSGGQTKYNRIKRGLPKTHWLDAANIGKSTPEQLHTLGVIPLRIEATGHGKRQMCGTDEHGFAIRHRQRKKVHFGYQTGDLVRAVVPKGKRTGVHVGRVLTRATGSFDIRTKTGRMAGISAHFCRPIHRNDGYDYVQGARHANPTPSAT
jgi:5-methylcytosine-specific restriction endonuclease McrA